MDDECINGRINILQYLYNIGAKVDLWLINKAIEKGHVHLENFLISVCKCM